MIEVLFAKYGEFHEKHGIGPVKWSHYDLFFLHRGEVVIRFDHDMIRLKEQEAVLIYPGSFFKGKSISEVSLASVIHFRLLDKSEHHNIFDLITRFNGSYRVFRNIGFVKQIQYDIDRLIRLPKNEDRHLAFYKFNLVSIIFSQLFNVNKPFTTAEIQNKKIQSLLAWMNNNMGEKILLAQLADQMGLSESQFRAVFRKTLGMSPGKYLQKIRMDKACQLLCERRVPIKGIGLLVGYEDVAHFYRAFYKYTGTTPKQYRDEHYPIG